LHFHVHGMCPTRGMSEDSLIRAENLIAFMEAKGWGTTRLGEEVDRSPTQLGDMIATPPRKPFGEKIARHIEAKLNLPRGWLDQIHDAESGDIDTAVHLADARKKEAEAAHMPQELSIQSRRIARALDEISDSAKRSEIAMVLLDIIDDLKGKI